MTVSPSAPRCADMLTVPQAAAQLGLSEQRIRQLCASGKLRAQKLGRDWLIESPIRRVTGKSGRPVKQ